MRILIIWRIPLAAAALLAEFILNISVLITVYAFVWFL